jgi:hypothetical protein
VELSHPNAQPRIDREELVQRYTLALLKSSKVEFSPTSFCSGRSAFTSSEMRHNFAIWAANNHADIRQRRHIYYCIRCKQTFSVDERDGSVSALDSYGHPLKASAAAKRLHTFSGGPCPAFKGLAGSRLTSKIIPFQRARRFTVLGSAGRRAWKAILAQWHRLSTANRATRNTENY